MADDALPPPPEGFKAVEALPPPPAGYKPIAAPGLMESLGRGLVEGATFGLDDKLGLDKERREASRKANPWTHFAGEVLGGAIPMAAASLLPTGAGQVAAAGRAGQLATRGGALLRAALVPGESASVGQAIGQGAKVGGVYGGLSGAGHADVKPDDSLPEALTKAAVGAATGLATGAPIGAIGGGLGHGLYRGAQTLGGLKALAEGETAGLGQGAIKTATRKLEDDRITPQQLIDQIKAEFPDDTAAAGGLGKRFWGDLQNRQPITAEQVEEVVRRAMAGEEAADISAALRTANGGQGPGPAAVQTLLDELAARHLGPLNLVDRAGMVRTGSGDNTQMTMRAAAATPGEHLPIIRENLLERQLGAGDRLKGLIETTVGTSDLEGAIAKNRAKFQEAASGLYGDAFAKEQPFHLAPIFNRWEARFDQMRGVVPDTVRARLNAMLWSEGDTLGGTARNPPTSLQGFMFAREGLRDLIREQKEGSHLRKYLTQLYNEMSDEVAATNPAWKKANDLYRDGAAADEAVELGRQLATRQNAPSREALAALATADKESAQAARDLAQARRAYEKAKKTGAVTTDQQAAFDYAKAKFDAIDARQRLIRTAYAQNLTDLIANQGETHDLVRKLLLPGSKNIIGKVLGEDAPRFIKALQAEAAIHRTYKSQFGSQTTPLREAVDELNWAPSFEAAWHNLGLGKVLQLASEYAARHINTKRNTDLMRLYTERDPLKQMEILRAMQTLHTARSNAGNALGRPAIGVGSGLVPEAVVAEEAQPARPVLALPPLKP